MAVFVGSNNNDSEIRSNRVGFAVSTTNPGSAAEGDSYYNGTANALNIYDGSAWNAVGGGAGGNFEAVASGTINDGQAVIISTDGTVKTPTTSTVSNNPTITNGGNFTNVENSYNTVSHQPGTSKYLVFYRDGNDNDYGKCVVGTLNNDKTSFSFGSIVTFESARVEIYGAVYVPNIGKHVVMYSDHGNSRHLLMVLCT